MGESENVLTPRQLAVARIARAITELRAEVEAYEADHDMADLFHSRVRVFLRQTLVELERAADHLRLTDMADG